MKQNWDFEEAQKYLEQSNEEMLKAHGIQTDLIVKEASGETIDLGLIMNFHKTI